MNLLYNTSSIPSALMFAAALSANASSATRSIVKFTT